MLKRWLFLGLTVFFFCLCGAASGKTLVYQGEDGKYRIETIIVPEQDGFMVKTVTGDGEQTTYGLDNLFAISTWEYKNEQNGVAVIGERRKDEIRLAGQFKGKKVEQVYKIDANPWFQEWGLGLHPFVLSEETVAYYWSIDPGSLKVVKFKAVKKKTETIKWRGEEYKALWVRITIEGVPEMFFRADYWFRIPDGRELRSRMPRGAFQPATVVELISEG